MGDFTKLRREGKSFLQKMCGLHNLFYIVQNNFKMFLLTFLALSVILCLALKVAEC